MCSSLADIGGTLVVALPCKRVDTSIKAEISSVLHREVAGSSLHHLTGFKRISHQGFTYCTHALVRPLSVSFTRTAACTSCILIRSAFFFLIVGNCWSSLSAYF